MKASELRIGNYIMDTGGKVWSIYHWEDATKIANKPNIYKTEDGKFEFEGHPWTENIQDATPVPLTEEWLMKFGFEKTHANWYAKNFFTTEDADDIHFLSVNAVSKRAGVYEGDINGIFIGQLIEYVHQLQNLYFALTGEELTITDLVTKQTA